MHFFLITVAGFAGSFHCIGMCGGFACGLGSATKTPSARQKLSRHFLYNTGRVVTYMFIGALAGILGSTLTGGDAHAVTAGAHHAHHMTGMVFTGSYGVFQRMLSILAGGLMLVMSMQLFGIWRHRPQSWLVLGGERMVSPIRSVMASHHPGAPVALGVLNGFLPCPLVYAFATMAAASGSIAGGILIMAAFGLGTFPAMLLTGWIGSTAKLSQRQLGVRMAGVFIAVFGLFTLFRGVLPSVMHGSA